MSLLSSLYRHSLGLLTDLYELTMAAAYRDRNLGERDAVFQLSFRRAPFGGGGAIACGLEQVVELIEGYRFDDDDITYLRGLRGIDGRPLFSSSFTDELRELQLRVDVDAVPEGTIVFAQEPLVRVRGPILQCQLLEPALLTIVNFQTLIATKAARICGAAQGDPVIDFGLRRAHGIDGAVSASRAAFVGGCTATSNVLAGKLLGIPVRGTHGHSWVLCHDDELEAFRGYAQALPNNCVFVVDTFDSIEGVRNAITVGRELREGGHELAGIRLDSGDLHALSLEARRLLDDAGLTTTAIMASNDLDEDRIADLRRRGAAIGVWGVGTRLVTAHDSPSLGGVYKLAAVKNDRGEWEHRVKVSNDPLKISNPGAQQIRRYVEGGHPSRDVIFLEESPPDGSGTHQDLLEPTLRAGRRVEPPIPLTAIRERCRAQLASFKPVDTSRFPVVLDDKLERLKRRLVDKARGDQ